LPKNNVNQYAPIVWQHHLTFRFGCQFVGIVNRFKTNKILGQLRKKTFWNIDCIVQPLPPPNQIDTFNKTVLKIHGQQKQIPSFKGMFAVNVNKGILTKNKNNAD